MKPEDTDGTRTLRAGASTLNPLTAVDKLVAQCFSKFEPIKELILPGRILVWDREVDTRGESNDATDQGTRLWVVPSEAEVDFDASSGSTRFVIGYRIGIGAGGARLEDCRRIEWQVIRVVARLNAGIGPDGRSLDWSSVSPLIFESAAKLRGDIERTPLSDPREWRNICDVRLVMWAADVKLTD